MDKIRNVHDRFFLKIFSDVNNIRSFLELALPTQLLKVLDFSNIEFDLKSYITGEIKGFFSDMVIKTQMFTQDRKNIDADVYFLFEHKSYRDNRILIQLLKYMYLMWQKDTDAGKPLRIIIPIVFYHGKPDWNLPRSFSDQFEVSREIKEHLLNYRYVLFDTNKWDLDDERNQSVNGNVNLMAYLFLMKSSFHRGLDSIKKSFEFWQKRGLVEDTDFLLSSLNYIVSTKDVRPAELIKILEESEIQGGEIMPTLAQRWIDQGVELGIEEGIEKGMEKGIERGIEKGIEKGKIEAARGLIKNGVALDTIARSIGIPLKELKKLTASSH